MNKKPNIILITTDQQRFDTISALGNQVIYTPHLNWLVHEGITYTSMYADCPICIASRSTIMTGKKGYTTGVVGNYDELLLKSMGENPTLPAVLTKNGYQTKAVGKMHFYPVRANYGFESIELPLDYYRYMKKEHCNTLPKVHGNGENEIEPAISTVDEQHSLTYWTVDRSVDFLETRDPTRPFFLWTSFTKPHPPLDPLLSYWNLYDTDDMPPPCYGEWSKDASNMPHGGFTYYTFLLNNIHLLSPKQQKAVKRAYYALITQVDYNLGILFGRLRELDLLKNTWIIFTSDHGDMLGDHHLGAKMTFFEGAAHVPMIIKAPSQSHIYNELKSKRTDVPVEMSDIYTTILNIAKIESNNTDSRNMLKVYEENERHTIFGNCENTNFMVLIDGYKYLYTIPGGHSLLFNLKNDPYEQKDLSRDNIYGEVMVRMKDLLINWAKKYCMALLDKNGDLVSTSEYTSTINSPKWPGHHTIKVEDVDVLH